MLMRFDPFREFEELTEQLRGTRRARSMPLDAYRVEDVLHVDIDLPGMNPESVEVTVEKNVLSVKAERHWETEGVDVVLSERPVGTFTRQLFLGENLSTDKISASYENGVLRLAIPVVEGAKARRIEVTASTQRQTINPKTAA